MIWRFPTFDIATRQTQYLKPNPNFRDSHPKQGPHSIFFQPSMLEGWEATAQCGINHRVLLEVVSKNSNNTGINIPGPNK